MARAGVGGVGSSNANHAVILVEGGAKSSTTLSAAASTVRKGDEAIGTSLADVSVRAFGTGGAQLAAILVGGGH